MVVNQCHGAALIYVQNIHACHTLLTATNVGFNVEDIATSVSVSTFSIRCRAHFLRLYSIVLQVTKMFKFYENEIHKYLLNN
jgi:hypothetical protein